MSGACLSGVVGEVYAAYRSQKISHDRSSMTSDVKSLSVDQFS